MRTVITLTPPQAARLRKLGGATHLAFQSPRPLYMDLVVIGFAAASVLREKTGRTWAYSITDAGRAWLERNKA
jgi:hypothetical protein